MAQVVSDALVTLGTMVAASTFLAGFQAVRFDAQFTRLTSRADELEGKLEDRADSGTSIVGEDIARVGATLRQLSAELRQGAVASVVRLLNASVGIGSLAVTVVAAHEGEIAFTGHFSASGLMLTSLFGLQVLVLVTSEVQRKQYRDDVRLLLAAGPQDSHKDEAGASRLLLAAERSIRSAYGPDHPATARSVDIEHLRRHYRTWASPHLWAAERMRRFGVSSNSSTFVEAFDEYRRFSNLSIESDFTEWWRGAISSLGEIWTRPWEQRFRAETESTEPAIPAVLERMMTGTLPGDYGEVFDANTLVMLCLRQFDLATVCSPYGGTSGKNILQVPFLFETNRGHAVARVALAHFCQSFSDPDTAEYHRVCAWDLVYPLCTEHGADSYTLSLASLVAYGRSDWAEAGRLATGAIEAAPLLSNIIGVSATSCSEEAALIRVACSIKQGHDLKDEYFDVPMQRDPGWFPFTSLGAFDRRGSATKPDIDAVDESQGYGEYSEDVAGVDTDDRGEELHRILMMRMPLSIARKALLDRRSEPVEVAEFCFQQALDLHLERIPERFWRWTPLNQSPLHIPDLSSGALTSETVDRILRSEF